MENKLPKVFVVILNFNGIKVLNNCLACVFNSDYSNLEIIVVDNASTDESLTQARLKYSRATFIKNSHNIGFSKGNNIGIRYALEKFADYVFILNNDTLIEKNTISQLVKTAEKEEAIVSPLILERDASKIWFAGGKINWKEVKTTHVTNQESSTPYASEYLSGCAMIISKDVFKKIGLFDERFFLYYEDADFSLRAKNARFKLVVDPSIKIVHLEQSNTENTAKNYWLVLSGLIFFSTHAKGIKKLWFLLHLRLRKMKNFYAIHFLKNQSAKHIHQAYLDFKKVK
ncbi:MAG: glycosyl transferase family protein [uncultured bacterium]|nr:MAG: glycosyl transferase family protein [uncultured bacterium]